MNRHNRIMIALLSGLVLLVAHWGKWTDTVMAASNQGIPVGAPAVQLKFCKTVVSWNEEFDRWRQAEINEQNPLKREALEKQHAVKGRYIAWDELYSLIGPTGEFTNWRGRLQIPFITRGGDGRLDFGVEIGLPLDEGRHQHRISFWTGRPDPYRFGGVNTTIAADSPLGQALASLDGNRDVTVSGKFVWITESRTSSRQPPGANDTYHFVSTGNGLDIRDPIFMVRFTSVSQPR